MNIIRSMSHPSLGRPDETPRIGSERGASGTAQPTGATSTAQDGVTLTSAAARLRNLENTISSLPVVDSQRVAEIKRSLADGSYEVNPQRIAEKMLDMEQQWYR